MAEWIAAIAGYVFAVVVGHFTIRPVVDRLWQALGWTESATSDIRPNHYLPELVGLVERTLYVIALQLGKGEFIGVWIALKVAGQWQRWGQGIRNRIFYRALEKAGFHRRPLHSTRHIFATLLLNQGESPVYVKEQMGHSSIKITVDVYGKWIRTTDRRAVNRLPSIGSAPLTSPAMAAD